jgi:glutathione S-transferase
MYIYICTYIYIYIYIYIHIHIGQSVSAPLSNPYAKGDEQYREVADFALRKIVHTMLLGSADDEKDNKALTKDMITLMPKNEVKKCLLYLRERIGVPRDMTVHGARQFRGHINWFISQIE